MDEVSVVIRAFHPDADQAFIYATWRNSAFYGSGLPKNESDRFFKAQTAKIKEILRVASVRIACLSDDPMIIVGYSIENDNHLHWIYVKTDFRNKGVGSLLMPKNIETVTDHLTKIGKILVEKKNLKTKGETNEHSREVKRA